MKAQEYSETSFGAVVPFDIVRQDADEYTTVFAEGSPALENLLKSLWKHGVETVACGNGYDERLENFSLESEQNIQSRYDTYLQTKGLRKAFMRKYDYEPTYHGYLIIDAATVNEPELFMLCIKKSLHEFKPEGLFTVNESHLNSITATSAHSNCIAIHMNVLRGKECTYHALDHMTLDEALKSSLPEKTTFDKYFNAIKNGLTKYFDRYQGKCERAPTEVHDVGTDDFSKGLIPSVDKVISQATQSADKQNTSCCVCLPCKHNFADISK